MAHTCPAASRFGRHARWLLFALATGGCGSKSALDAPAPGAPGQHVGATPPPSSSADAGQGPLPDAAPPAPDAPIAWQGAGERVWEFDQPDPYIAGPIAVDEASVYAFVVKAGNGVLARAGKSPSDSRQVGTPLATVSDASDLGAGVALVVRTAVYWQVDTQTTSTIGRVEKDGTGAQLLVTSSLAHGARHPVFATEGDHFWWISDRTLHHSGARGENPVAFAPRLPEDALAFTVNAAAATGYVGTATHLFRLDLTNGAATQWGARVPGAVDDLMWDGADLYVGWTSAASVVGVSHVDDAGTLDLVAPVPVPRAARSGFLYGFGPAPTELSRWRLDRNAGAQPLAQTNMIQAIAADADGAVYYLDPEGSGSAPDGGSIRRSTIVRVPPP
jgi:hypothetical protein